VGSIRGAGVRPAQGRVGFHFLLLFYARPWRHRRRLRHVSVPARRRGEPFYTYAGTRLGEYQPV